MSSVKEIVSKYLKAGGYDGLYSELGTCGCGLNDLMPCDSNTDNCEPAYLIYCPCCGEDIFVAARLCRKADENNPARLSELFGILADKPTSNGVYIPHE